MKRGVAILTCLLYAVVLFGLFAFIQTGGYGRLLAGDSQEGFDVTLLFTKAAYRLPAIAALCLTLLWFLDVHALTIRNTDQREGKRPTDHPLQYSVLRLRRCALVPLVLGYVVILYQVQPFTWELQAMSTLTWLIVFAVLLAVARRPLNWTPGDVVLWVAGRMSAFAEGFSRQR